MNTSVLKELLERVKGASGGDRYIDFWATVLLWEPDAADDLAAISADIELVGIEEMWAAMPFSSSLDAALSLVERVLPSANCHGYDAHPKGVDAYVSRNCVADGHWLFEGTAKTPALAMISALLQALLSDELGGGSSSTDSDDVRAGASAPNVTPEGERPFWVSWYAADRPWTLHTPWWFSGARLGWTAEGEPTEQSTVVAAVMATSAEHAQRLIRDAHDAPLPDLEWRFCNEREPGWSPYCDRFQKAEWMTWPAETPPSQSGEAVPATARKDEPLQPLRANEGQQE